MKKLICSDIDGTLLNAERDLSSKTISVIDKLKNKVPVVLISARMPSAMRHLQKQLGIQNQPFVAYNGGLISVNNVTKQSTTISFELVKKIVKSNTHDLHLSLYHNDDWFAPQLDQWTKREINNTKVNPTIKSNEDVLKLWERNNNGAHKIMCMGDAKLVSEFYDELAKKLTEDLHLYRSKDTYIEIAPKQISKKSAIEFLIASEFGLHLSDVLSFGDNYNDIEMLQASGHGVAVGNAKNEVKLAADEIIGNAKEDGVAEFLLAYFKM
ncbi:Cof-type HAD-IIB family hydrolase [Psychroflexus sp. CAK1W]|uniref:Cof-type HAD-IIB family hydrolase n=1 Tax=Psychroflexus curvus TaxID=2873595 RepID=UPI001CCE647F|nr:Cof-type HAD-IIB family hydrolase [Psychroflexus curvus]MBZ9627752.1 Cof-type HAD-IIB family hydrolase [Psychroflexus curvus]